MAATTLANGARLAASTKPEIAPTKLGRSFLSFLLFVALCAVGCGKKKPQEVVVYTAHDDVFSAPVLRGFNEQTGIEILTKTDTESTKTVGLAEAILAERGRPRCDLFWNNEVLHMIRLDKEGLLEKVNLPETADYPAQYKSSDGTWVGFAARARVLVVNTNRMAAARRPKTIHALTDPQWRDQCAIAKPLFGTTATHAACLFATWGDEKAKDFFEKVKANAKILSGNRDVARRVAAGELAFGLTDTDDAMVEMDAGSPIAIIYPDQGEDELGTLFIPNTVAVIKGSAHQENAKLLMAYLLKPETEGLLVRGESAQIPLNTKTKAVPRVETPGTVKAMQVDFEAAADKWNTAYEFLRTEFTAAK